MRHTACDGIPYNMYTQHSPEAGMWMLSKVYQGLRSVLLSDVSKSESVA